MKNAPSSAGRMVGLLFGTALLLPALAAADATIIHAGWLLAEPGRPPLRKHSIVIRDDHIVRVTAGYVSSAGDVPGESVRILDLSDKFVLPGLIDAHVHLASAPQPDGPPPPLVQTEADLAIIAAAHAEKTLQAGFTTVVDLGAAGIPGHEEAIFAVRDNILNGNIPGPRILAAGTPIAATGLARSSNYRDDVMNAIPMRSVCDGADACRRAVRLQVRRGADIIVFFNTGSLLAASPVPQAMTDDEMRAIVDTAHALGRKVIADGHYAAGIAAAHRAGADVLDSLHLYDASTFDSLRDGVFIQSHIHGIVRAVGSTPETLHDGLWGWLPDDVLLRLLAIRKRPFASVAAYRAGIRNIAYATDAGVYPWGENAADLAELTARGIPAADAIRFATVNAARMLGLDAQVGSIAPGKKADIVAVAGNPLNDISVLQQMNLVMRDGVVYRQDGQTRRPD